MPNLIAAAPASQIIRERLSALIRQSGTTRTQVARDLGQSHGWLSAKFAPEGAKRGREMTLGDVDLVLSALGLDATALLNPTAEPPAFTPE